MLHGVVGRTDEERRLAINTIGPLWDGNEVWLIVAGAGMFAAFPGWYATMFSGFYLRAGAAARRRSSCAASRSSSADKRESPAVAAAPGARAHDRREPASPRCCIGIALGDLLHGVPIDAQQEFTGTLLDLLSPYGVFVGRHRSSLLCVTARRDVPRAQGGRATSATARAPIARPAAPVTALAVLVFVVWTQVVDDRGVIPGLVPASACWLAAATALLVRRGPGRLGLHVDHGRHGRHRLDDLPRASTRA